MKVGMLPAMPSVSGRQTVNRENPHRKGPPSEHADYISQPLGP
jgi:hypothetical protein